MGNTAPIILLFMLSLSFGVFILLPFNNSEVTGKGLVKIFTVISAASFVISLIIYNPLKNEIFPIPIIAAVIGLVTTLIFHQDKKTNISRFLWGVGAIGLLTSAYLLLGKNTNTGIYFLITSFLVGSVTYAMILGHWYLVVPKMSETPLQIGIIFIFSALIIKFCYGLFFVNEFAPYIEPFSQKGDGYTFNWIIIIMRYLWGYLALTILGVMAWKCVKIRSLQSATGILYVMVFFNIIGEIMSTYIYYNWGIGV
jgi:hypothetical protein